MSNKEAMESKLEHIFMISMVLLSSIKKSIRQSHVVLEAELGDNSHGMLTLHTCL